MSNLYIAPMEATVSKTTRSLEVFIQVIWMSIMVQNTFFSTSLRVGGILMKVLILDILTW